MTQINNYSSRIIVYNLKGNEKKETRKLSNTIHKNKLKMD